LQQRLSSSADDEPRSAIALWPLLRNRISELLRGTEFASTIAIRAEKVCVAKLADRLRAIRLAAAPQIASAKAAEDCGATGVHALTLQRVEDLFDCVGHR
jgi:hypothetical protein